MSVSSNIFTVAGLTKKTVVKRLCTHIIISNLIFLQFSFAQRNKIDSLLKILPALKDTARIDCWYQLGRSYRRIHNEDSALYYANMVYEESKRINYMHGLGEACVAKAVIAYYYFHSFPLQEQMAREAIKWFSLTSNKKYLDHAYGHLCYAASKQGSPDEAIAKLKQYYQQGQRTNNKDLVRSSLETMAHIYRDRGDYDSVLQMEEQIIQTERKNDGPQTYTFHELWVLGLTYRLLEEYSTALSYWRPLFMQGVTGSETENKMDYAELWTLANEPDSALYYYDQFDSARAETGDLRAYLISKGEYYLYLREYKTALSYFYKALIYHRQYNDESQQRRTLLDIGKAYYALQKYDSAILYARQGLTMALQQGSKPSVRDGYEILYNVYNNLQKADSAFKYYRNYIIMKEAVMNNQTRGKLAAYKFEHTIESLNEKTALQQQQLQQEKTNRDILIAAMIMPLLLSVFAIRSSQLKRKKDQLQHQMAEANIQLENRKKEQQLSELLQQKTQLEMQALRTQINPHFIFNCLNSINRFIQTNKQTDAADYLSKFAKLIRIVLQQSGKSLIPLEDELNSLRLYMDLETLRFEKPFFHEMNTNGIDVSSILVPPLLLQPFVENAIWHGLHPMENGCGKIVIDMHLENDMLHCAIYDNGIGRIKSLLLKKDAGKRSMGIELTRNRLQLIDTLNAKKTGVEFNDLVSESGQINGTCVLIKIPVKAV